MKASDYSTTQHKDERCSPNLSLLRTPVRQKKILRQMMLLVVDLTIGFRLVNKHDFTHGILFSAFKCAFIVF